MKSKNNSPSLDVHLNSSNNCASPNQGQNISNVSNNQSNICDDKKITTNQELIEQGDLNNFDISFFLSKELCQNLEGEEEFPEKNNDNIDNNCYSQNEFLKFNIFNQNNKFKFSPINNNSKDYFETNKNNYIPNLQNQFGNCNNNNYNENLQELKNNNYNVESNNLRIGNNMNEGNNIFSSNTNINNFFINNNSQPINLQLNNNPIINGNFQYSQNCSNLFNFPQITNNQIFNYENDLMYRNFNNYINNYQINRNEFSNLNFQNQFKNKNSQADNNIKQRKKKVIDEYTIEMFGRRGWICELCNNFNYDTRKKCNRCHIIKKPKRIEDYLLGEKNKNIGNKHYWHCKYCGNYNYAFRLVCNRCQAKKEVP